MASTDPLHDEINLIRLVRRLNKPSPVTSPESWIKAQGTLQKVKFARKLLRNVEGDGKASSKRAQQLEDIRIQLDEIEASLKDIEKPQSPLRMQILPTLPRPAPPRSLTLDLAPSSSLPTVDGEGPAVPTDDLLLPADTSAYPTSTSFIFPTPIPPLSAIPSTSTTNLLPPFQSTSTAAATTGFLPASNALQNELTTQLANMAAQLRRNAQHFSETLGRDQAVTDELQEKLTGNFDVMKKERVRLRDHRACVIAWEGRSHPVKPQGLKGYNPYPDTALPLLAQVLDHLELRRRNVDLSHCSLLTAQILPLLHSLHDLRRLSLRFRHHRYHPCRSRNSLETIPSLNRLVVLNTSVTDQAPSSLLQTQKLFFNPEALIHPLLIDATKRTKFPNVFA
ncbi:hypothetical protein DXG01_009406 [Tephrocybe rancida]|nr:hypothetical protein DXG01_009406 [Tephrocybe rancida]